MSKRTSPESAMFRVNVLGSEDNRVHSEGTIETTPTCLIYTDDQGSKLNWPLHLLTKYGSNGERLFTVEAGDQCPSGPGVYIFTTPHAPYLENIVTRHLSVLLKSGRMASPDPDAFLSLPRNGLRPSTTPPNGLNNSKFKSASLWSLPSNKFQVENLTDKPNITRGGILEVSNQDLVFTDGTTGRRFQWPLVYLRRYGYERNVFSIDASSKCPGGEGIFSFMSDRASELQDLVRTQSKNCFGSQMSLFSPPPPSQAKTSVVKVPTRTQADDSPVFQRSNSLLRRARSAMDLNRNLYEVINISDERKEVGKGTLEVTASDILYIDRLTDEKWRWPLKYLRRYGCDGNVFSFEAGRRCPGGEGLYAFSCDQASEIHEAILLSINGGRKRKEEKLMCASTLSLADPNLGARRGSEQTARRSPELTVPGPRRRSEFSGLGSGRSEQAARMTRRESDQNLTNGLQLTTPPSVKQCPQVPLPEIPADQRILVSATPPRSPSVQSDHLSLPRGSVSSPSLDENDSSEVSSLSSGVTTPPPSGMSTPPPKPPRSEKRKVKKKTKSPARSEHIYDSVNKTNDHTPSLRDKPVHMYEDPALAQREYLDSISNSAVSNPQSSVNASPKAEPHSPHKDPKQHTKIDNGQPSEKQVEKKSKSKKKPKPAAKSNSLLKLLGKRKSIDSGSKAANNDKKSNDKSSPMATSPKESIDHPGTLYENLTENGKTFSPKRESMYANLPSSGSPKYKSSPKHMSMYANIPTQGSMETTSVPDSSSVPQPHRGNTPPPLVGIPDTPSTYQNVSLLVEESIGSPSNMYANIEVTRNGRVTSPPAPQVTTNGHVTSPPTPRVTAGPASYAEVEFIKNPVTDSNRSPDSSLGSTKGSPDISHDAPHVIVSPNNSIRSNDTTSSTEEERVQYERLDFIMMEAVKTQQKQRVSNETFANILERHAKRDNEKNKTGRRNK